MAHDIPSTSKPSLLTPPSSPSSFSLATSPIPSYFHIIPSDNVTTVLLRACSNGEAEVISEMVKAGVNINLCDEDGNTALHYAACFGHANVVRVLLDAGADCNKQDIFGWTALMWAISNSHESIVRDLLAHGANPAHRSARGRTALDFARTKSNRQLEELIASYSSATHAIMTPNPGKEIEDREDEMEHSLEDFVWDRCLADQMFVFSMEDIPYLMEVIMRIAVPLRVKSHKWVPANVLFLCARFAHHYNGPEVLQLLLCTAIEKIDGLLKSQIENCTALMAFWIANVSRLLFYLKRDPHLDRVTGRYRASFISILHRLYASLVLGARRQLERILDGAVLEHNPIPDMNVHFEGEWRLFNAFSGAATALESEKAPSAFERAASCSPELQHRSGYFEKRNSSGNVLRSALRLRRSHPRSESPCDVTALLSSTLYLLRAYGVHPSIISHFVLQQAYFLGAELFNRVLEGRRYLCRSKALQIRMNVSVLEEWFHTHLPQLQSAGRGESRTHGAQGKRELPEDVCQQYFAPLIQLLQLLQILTQHSDFLQFADTVRKLHLLHPVQVRRCVLEYRYEVGETKLAAECVLYARQVVENAAVAAKMFARKGRRVSGNSSAETARKAAEQVAAQSRGKAAAPREGEKSAADRAEKQKKTRGESLWSMVGRERSFSAPSSESLSIWASPTILRSRKKPTSPLATEKPVFTFETEGNSEATEEEGETTPVKNESIMELKDSRRLLPLHLPYPLADTPEPSAPLKKIDEENDIERLEPPLDVYTLSSLASWDSIPTIPEDVMTRLDPPAKRIGRSY
ncbi:uncharacterized protein VTP21DRAFT_6818 [Calcarisporiella thermophila]|uniref:uncharacterized protein n=1 Tax=Calcarisporiella thermophila TaxID=911321 RepID=UPI0037447D56